MKETYTTNTEGNKMKQTAKRFETKEQAQDFLNSVEDGVHMYSVVWDSLVYEAGWYIMSDYSRKYMI